MQTDGMTVSHSKRPSAEPIQKRCPNDNAELLQDFARNYRLRIDSRFAYMTYATGGEIDRN